MQEQRKTVSVLFNDIVNPVYIEWGGSLGLCGERKRAILGAEMRKSIIVSAKYGQCIYSGPLRIAEITNFCLSICGNREKNCGNAELHTPSDLPIITGNN